MAIVLPGRMFRAEYQKRRLDPKNLSRTLEDAGTLTSVLVPWNTCGAFIAQTLGVATLNLRPLLFLQPPQSDDRRPLRLHQLHDREAPRVVLRGRIGRCLRRDLLRIRGSGFAVAGPLPTGQRPRDAIEARLFGNVPHPARSKAT